MKIKISVIILNLLLIITSSILVSANFDDEIKIICGFSYLKSDVSPIIMDEYTLIPIRSLAEELKFEVEWQEEQQDVIVKNSNNNLHIKINSKEVLRNGAADEMPVNAVILENRTFVPIRYIAEFFGKKVNYVEWNDGKYIWITDFDLLSAEDVVPDSNYYSLNDYYDKPHYLLKEDGTTFRGIKIGDTIDKVKNSYGIPMRIENNGNILVYIGKYEPNTEADFMYFTFEKGILVSVELDII